MTTYRAKFYTHAHTNESFNAHTPEKALQIARQFFNDDFRFYDKGARLDRIEIWHGKKGWLAKWESNDNRLRRAARDLLEALEGQTEAAQAVIDNWSSGDLAAAVRTLDGALDSARAAITKAKPANGRQS